MSPNNVLTAAGPVESGAPPTQATFVDRLAALAEKWRKGREADLALRLETGALLNAEFGSPEARKTRGRKQLKEAAEQLLLTESELSRMRRFAFYFRSLEDLKQKYPLVTTWTAVKELLPLLNSGLVGGGAVGSGAESPRAEGPKAPTFKAVKRALEGLSSDIREASNGLTEQQKKELLATFQEVAKAVEDCLKVRVSVDQVREGEVPPLSLTTTCAVGTGLLVSA